MGQFLDRPGTPAGAKRQLEQAQSEHDDYLFSLNLPKFVFSQIPLDDMDKRRDFLGTLDLNLLPEEARQKVADYRKRIAELDRELLSYYDGTKRSNYVY